MRRVGAVRHRGAIADGDAALAALQQVALLGVALDQLGLDGDIVVQAEVQLQFGVLCGEVEVGRADVFVTSRAGVKDVELAREQDATRAVSRRRAELCAGRERWHGDVVEAARQVIVGEAEGVRAAV